MTQIICRFDNFLDLFISVETDFDTRNEIAVSVDFDTRNEIAVSVDFDTRNEIAVSVLFAFSWKTSNFGFLTIFFIYLNTSSCALAIETFERIDCR